jgi:hypothetical protein
LTGACGGRLFSHSVFVVVSEEGHKSPVRSCAALSQEEHSMDLDRHRGRTNLLFVAPEFSKCRNAFRSSKAGVWQSCVKIRNFFNLPLNTNAFKDCVLLSREPFLGAFAKLRKATVSFVTFVCPSVWPHGISQLPMHGFSWNLVFEDFSKIQSM